MRKTCGDKKRTLILAAAAAGLFLLMAAAWLVLRPRAVQGAKTVTVEICHTDGSEKKTICHTDAEYLRRLLEDEGLASGPETPYGLWLETMDGETADPERQQWWGYDVNGDFAVYGVDEQVVNDGDVFCFRLNEGY